MRLAGGRRCCHRKRLGIGLLRGVADDRRRRQVASSHAFFVVRPTPASTNTILLQLATNTWHAYNDFGGRNLYNGATQSSFQRPMERGYLFKPRGAGRRVTTTHPPDHDMNTHVGYLRFNHLSAWAGSAGWPDWEWPFLAWAERNGYGIDVISNADLEEHPSIIDGYRLLLSVGHDEYWSGPMRDTVEGFIARGGNVAFFSGNTSLWQVRLEDPVDGSASVMVGYKGMYKKDPVYETDRMGELTSIWSDHLIGRPENHMTGVSFTAAATTASANAHQRCRRLHRLPARPLDLRRHRRRLRRRARGQGHDRRLRVRRLRVHDRRRFARAHRDRRHATELRDPRHGARRPFHPDHVGPAAEAR
ncbi:MAG: DUF6605 domain-containing protein [Acidimicrobiales bacterium]